MTPPPAAELDLDAIEARAKRLERFVVVRRDGTLREPPLITRECAADILALTAEVRRLTRERDAETERCAKLALEGVVEMKARDPRWFDEEIATREEIAAAIRAAR